MGHAPRSPCLTVAFYAVNKGRVLLIHHKKMNKWLPPGGHVESGESIYDALLREIREETQLDNYVVLGNRSPVKEEGRIIMPAPTFMDIHAVYDGFAHQGLFYFIKATNDKVVLNKEEHNDIRWFTIEEMKKENVISGVIQYSELAIRFVDALDRP